MERRKFKRQDVRRAPIRATLMLSGKSLITNDVFNVFEIDARLLDLSQGGMSVRLSMDSQWETLSPAHKVDLLLERGNEKTPLSGEVVRVAEDHSVSLEFSEPLTTVSRLLTPEELQ